MKFHENQFTINNRSIQDFILATYIFLIDPTSRFSSSLLLLRFLGYSFVCSFQFTFGMQMSTCLDDRPTGLDIFGFWAVAILGKL